MVWQDTGTFDAQLSSGDVLEEWQEGFEGAGVQNFKTGSPSEDFTQDAGMTLTVSSSRFSFTDSTRYVTEGDRAVKAVPGGWGPEHGPKQWEAANDPTNTPLNNAYGALRFTFTRPVNFLAMDITDLGTSDGQSVLTGLLGSGAGSFWPEIDLLTAGAPHACAQGDQQCNNVGIGQQLFFALSSATPFDSIEIGLKEGDTGDDNGFVLDDFVGFDNLRFGSVAAREVPAPGSLWLLLPGLLLLGRRVKAHPAAKSRPRVKAAAAHPVDTLLTAVREAQ